ncbi:MAG: hypothetical protein RL134_948 [Actinomycetota bacterium]
MLCEDPDVKAIDVARAERQELCDLLLEVGPDAATLCAGWTTRDLAAHLVVRESRPDAAVGILVKPLSGYADSVQAKVARRPWTELVRDVRSGPPLLSPFRLPGAQGIADPFEFAIHHEDVRRAQPGWAPRALPVGEQDLLWQRLARAGRLLARSSPVGVALRRSDTGEMITAKPGTPAVTLIGEPLELVLRLYGRHECIVDVEGPEESVARFEAARFGV